MPWHPAEDEKTGPEKLDSRSFFVVLLCGAIGAAATFLWTVESHEPEQVNARGTLRQVVQQRGPTLRSLYAAGRYEELVAVTRSQRRGAQRDPEPWLFGAFAHEALAAEPGLESIEHRAEAARIWAELLEKCERSIRNPRSLESVRSPRYNAGWALLGLGHPVMARERFGSHVSRLHRNGVWRDSTYNRACYLALAGDHEGAIQAWNEMVDGPIIVNRETEDGFLFRDQDVMERAVAEDREMADGAVVVEEESPRRWPYRELLSVGVRWVVVDPDLEPIHDYLWENDLWFRVWRILLAHENQHRRAAESAPVPVSEPSLGDPADRDAETWSGTLQ